MKVIYVIICLAFLDLSVCYGQNLFRNERKIGMSCDISNDTLYSIFINHSPDTVVIRLCTTVLEGPRTISLVIILFSILVMFRLQLIHYFMRIPYICIQVIIYRT